MEEKQEWQQLEHSLGLFFTNQISGYINKCTATVTEHSFTVVIISSFVLWSHVIGKRIPKQLMPTSGKCWYKVVGLWWCIQKSNFFHYKQTQVQQCHIIINAVITMEQQWTLPITIHKWSNIGLRWSFWLVQLGSYKIWPFKRYYMVSIIDKWCRKYFSI